MSIIVRFIFAFTRFLLSRAFLALMYKNPISFLKEHIEESLRLQESPAEFESLDPIHRRRVGDGRCAVVGVRVSMSNI